MSGENSINVGGVLGATTAVGAGVAVLPETGESTIGTALVALAIICGGIVLASAIVRLVVTKIC